MRKSPQFSTAELEARRERLRAVNARLHGHKDDDYYRATLKGKLLVTEVGCWEFTGFRNPQKGYGQLYYRGKIWPTHRLAYHLWKGPVPKGICVCHTCDNRPCCNPLHLFLGTFDTNNKDMAAKGRCKYSAKSYPRCKRGHEFTPENTRVCSRGFRRCITCDNLRFATPEYKAWAREYRKRRRAKLKADRCAVGKSG